MPSRISANKALSSYALFNATDIKDFIINQLKQSDDTFKDVDYLGSNINAFIDIIAVMLQQILFSYSVNASETTFSTAVLYENMSKLVSLLNYKTVGKQTSMLPVKITVDKSGNGEEDVDACIPRFLTLNYNSQYVLLNEIAGRCNSDKIFERDTLLFQGSVAESEIFSAVGDEFETIRLIDPYIKNSEKFISDNFFVVYVKRKQDGVWTEFTETANLFLENATAEKYERRFTEDFNYEFKFGNGKNGLKLNAGDEIIIYYLISNGESALIGDGVITESIAPTIFNSNTYAEINNQTQTVDLNGISIRVTGPSSAVSYPESVDSIRKNAPKVFSSQNRLFSLNDYKVFIEKNFKSYCKATHLMNNDDYTGKFLKYYYDLGLASPQKDSRINLAQVEFMTAVNFNNIYAFIVPAVNTIIDGKVPSYLNVAIKQFIATQCKPYMGATHNLVLLDPIYKAFTFGTYNLNDDVWNKNQLETKLVLVKNKFTKYSNSFIKDYCVDALETYFNSLTLGSSVNPLLIETIINSVPGVTSFYLIDNNGITNDNINLYVWNPLYKEEDNSVVNQTTSFNEFTYPYFYDISELKNKVVVVDEN